MQSFKKVSRSDALTIGSSQLLKGDGVVLGRGEVDFGLGFERFGRRGRHGDEMLFF